ncbi:hypothetical protein PHYPSEUDO_003341 [Phytophthora pseudosyringae]|uniref:Cation-transporting P-type ATPase C-terminal domain-containing protein n=1 Tax=Phytophthora pseudosyringae TaxID=221518 RepID=A0A8T1VRZ6_9STRA|nr:hypothetical protein PHYPSEUDO_003341 [Phytophthora pseudosyringae]
MVLPDTPRKALGSQTEGALLAFATAGSDGELNYAKMRTNANIRRLLPSAAIVNACQWLFRAKTMRTSGARAPELVLARCTQLQTRSGGTILLTNDRRQWPQKNVLAAYTKRGYRTLWLAYRDSKSTGEAVDSASAEVLEQQLVCLALVTIADLGRTPASCQRAGIVVRELTARSIARECGILSASEEDSEMYTVMDGPDFRALVLRARGELRQEIFDQVWPSLRVLARSSPQDKNTLVTGLRASKLFATATRSRDRRRHERRASASGSSHRLRDGKERHVRGKRSRRHRAHGRRPCRRRERRSRPLVTPRMAKHIAGQTALQLTLLLLLTFVGDKWFNVPSGHASVTKDDDSESTEHLTVVFNTFVWLQLFNQLNCRQGVADTPMLRLPELCKNKLGIAALCAQCGLQVAIVQLGGELFHCAPLSAAQWGACIASGLGTAHYQTPASALHTTRSAVKRHAQAQTLVGNNTVMTNLPFQQEVSPARTMQN